MAILLVACGGSSKPHVDSDPDASVMIDAAPDTPLDPSKCAFNSTPLTCAPTAAPTTPGGTQMCNVLAQTGCAANEKCTWIADTSTSGHLGCAPAGAVQTECACSIGALGATGYDDCVKGDICVGGKCRAICGLNGSAPTCAAGTACERYANVLGNDIAIAGACDPTCDPLTQCMPSGHSEGEASACGSPNPATPTAGCYTANGLDYTCSPTSAAALTRTDRKPATGPATGGAFVNGCAPGFLPFFREQTGSTTIVCAGMCAPVKTDVTAPAMAKGDPAKFAKLPNEAASAAGNATCDIGKKGSEAQEDCVFMWPFNVQNGQLPPSPYNDKLGICFGYTHYTYDHDNNAATPPRPVPACEALPSKTALPANCTCTNGKCGGTGCPDGAAHEWGCWPSTSSFMGIAPSKGFRIGYGEGTTVRHTLEQ